MSRGSGQPGFPTHIKKRFVREHPLIIHVQFGINQVYFMRYIILFIIS